MNEWLRVVLDALTGGAGGWLAAWLTTPGGRRRGQHRAWWRRAPEAVPDEAATEQLPRIT